MKAFLPAFLLIVLASPRLMAQDSTMPQQQSSSAQTTMAPQGNPSGAQPTGDGAIMPDPSSSAAAPSKNKTYQSEGYGHRAELFVTGFALLGNQASGNGIIEQATDAAGGAVGYRFHLNSSSAIEGRYGFSRNSDKYTIGGAVSSIPSYFSEISASYVYQFANSHRIRPFVEEGGGVVLFIPGNYNTPTSAVTTTGGTATGTTSPAFPYALANVNADVAGAPVYSGSSAGVGTQAENMFLYGAGADIPAFSHFYFRTEFRGLGYKTPDFKLSPLHTNAFSFSYEPTIGIVYRF